MMHYLLVRLETNGEAGYEINSSEGLVEEVVNHLESVRDDFGIVRGAVTSLEASAKLDILFDNERTVEFE